MKQFVTSLTKIKDSNDIESNVESFINNLSKFKPQVKNIGIAMFHSLINLSQESPHIQILLDGAKQLPNVLNSSGSNDYSEKTLFCNAL